MENKETLEEFIQKSYPKTDSRYDFTVTSKIRNGIRLGAKWTQERSYSEQDMLEFGNFIFKNTLLVSVKGVEGVLKKFKNKY
jgi:hypothetical protein